MEKLIYHEIPHLVHIEMTYACNAQCIFCYNPERSKIGDIEKIERIVRRVKETEIPHVYLIGGEPSMLSVNLLNKFIDILNGVSSVTIVTNGIKYMHELSDKLACLGIPIHGKDYKTHEYCNAVNGSFKKTLTNIKQYVQDGFDVRCIPVLTSLNFDHIYEIIRISSDLGMESVFVDRFEDGGIGSKNSSKLKPTLDQFKESLSQMISARDDFGIKVGFGTAIPYCLDERLVSENMISDCGAGLTFAAIKPNGDVRACNQSDLVYGNILENNFEDIWMNSKFDKFRDLSWVSGICLKCPVLTKCICGCKVDANCSTGYCVDYAVRDLQKCPVEVKKSEKDHCLVTVPDSFRNFSVSKYLKINEKYKTKLFITRYQTIITDENSLEIIDFIRDNNIGSEEELINHLGNEYEKEDLRRLVSQLAQIGAINVN